MGTSWSQSWKTTVMHIQSDCEFKVYKRLSDKKAVLSSLTNEGIHNFGNYLVICFNDDEDSMSYLSTLSRFHSAVKI